MLLKDNAVKCVYAHMYESDVEIMSSLHLQTGLLKPVQSPYGNARLITA